MVLLVIAVLVVIGERVARQLTAPGAHQSEGETEIENGRGRRIQLQAMTSSVTTSDSMDRASAYEYIGLQIKKIYKFSI